MFTWGLSQQFLGVCRPCSSCALKSRKIQGMTGGCLFSSSPLWRSKQGWMCLLTEPENVIWMQILGVAFIRVSVSGEDWDELRGNAPRQWGEEETPAKDCVRAPQLYRHLQGSLFPPSPPHSPVWAPYFSGESHLDLCITIFFPPPAGWGWGVTQCLTSPLESVTHLHYLFQWGNKGKGSKEQSVWNKSLQSWREGVAMLPNFAGMKWNLQRSWRKWNICTVVTLGSPDEQWGPSVADALHTESRCCRCPGTGDCCISPGAITAKCKINTHEKIQRNPIIHTRITHGKTTLP